MNDFQSIARDACYVEESVNQTENKLPLPHSQSPGNVVIYVFLCRSYKVFKIVLPSVSSSLVSISTVI